MHFEEQSVRRIRKPIRIILLSYLATGFIDFNGFLICYGKSLQEEQDERDLRDAFRVLDKNKRGEIDVEDLRWILKELGDDLTEEEIDDMIRDTDTDGSGFVDFDVFGV
ncbi:unnamed protein product [Dicrocoelium dendriticum]|nr:unnamed protein product [Dicrocoelium dendriticum]